MEIREGMPGPGSEFDRLEGDMKESLAKIEDGILEAAARMEKAERDLAELRDLNQQIRDQGREVVDESDNIKLIKDIKQEIVDLEAQAKEFRDQLKLYYKADEIVHLKSVDKNN